MCRCKAKQRNHRGIQTCQRRGYVRLPRRSPRGSFSDISGLRVSQSGKVCLVSGVFSRRTTTTIAMTLQLYCLSALVVEFGHDRRTLAQKPAAVPPPEVRGKSKRWRLRDVLQALDAHDESLGAPGGESSRSVQSPAIEDPPVRPGSGTETIDPARCPDATPLGPSSCPRDRH